MQILGEALPGFRHIRAPLVAGYLWLLAAWLAVRPDLERPPHNALLRSLHDLGSDVGLIGVAAAASIAAYLVGSISQELWEFGRARYPAWLKGASGLSVAMKTAEGVASVKLDRADEVAHLAADRVRSALSQAVSARSLAGADSNEIGKAASRVAYATAQELDRETKLPAFCSSAKHETSSARLIVLHRRAS